MQSIHRASLNGIEWKRGSVCRRRLRRRRLRIENPTIIHTMIITNKHLIIRRKGIQAKLLRWAKFIQTTTADDFE